MKKTAACGSWPSGISAELMVSGNIGLSQATFFEGDIYWLESRPQEQGRNVIVYCDLQDDRCEKHELLPAKYNCRTQVHEYGGACFIPTGAGVFFTNHTDQQIYVALNNGDIKAVTRETGIRFADFAYSAKRNMLVAVAEEHDARFSEPRNYLVAISIADGALHVLHSGEDFYASAKFAPDGDQLCWISWNHPNMPWDGTSLWVAEVKSATGINHAKVVAGGTSESVFQPGWSPAGELYFVSDRTNWWNLYRLCDEQVKPVCPVEAEFGMPQWQFGMTRYGFIGDDKIVSSYSQNGSEALALLDVSSSGFTTLSLDHTAYQSLTTSTGNVCYIAQSPTAFPALYSLEIAGAGNTPNEERLIAVSSTLDIDSAQFSRGKNITFPSASGAYAHGFFYPPVNAEYEAPDGELPPLIVMIHGGPTSSTQNDLSLKVQFWTNRGFAVLDVNYRGSTGFGRKYRDALKTLWGVVDVEDCDYGVRYLVEKRLVDADRVAIRGGSAGGFTALAALAGTDTFKAGASLYGVTDLTALATDTHKFESRYLDTLIGPFPEARALYEQRSPVNQADSINSPVIFLQGLEDKVVPPAQAESMIEVLLKKGVKVAYVPFEGEAHGFRKSENICRAFAAELWFYGEIFGFGGENPGAFEFIDA